MDRVPKGAAYLHQLAEDGVISHQGADYITIKIDPFFDGVIKNLVGETDAQTGASVVRCIKQSITIKKPDDVVGNWDVHIIMWPWITSAVSSGSTGSFAVSPRFGQVITPPELATIPFGKVGGLQVFYVPQGQNLEITQPPGATKLIGQMNVDQEFTAGVTRLLSMGFEVHNTTSPLNQQGAVTVYKQMSNSNDNVHWTIADKVGADEIYTNFSGPMVRYPPISQAEALLLHNSKQWEAKKGCYCVAGFFSVEDRAVSIEPTCPVIAADKNGDLEGAVNTSNVNMPIPGPIVPGTNYTRSMPSFRVYNVHQSGAIFTGLSEQTTLTINWNVYLETFPDNSQASILPLATPSGEFDPKAIAIYTHIEPDMPPGVEAGMNADGDWFMTAIADIADYLGPVISLMPHPAAKVIGAGLTAGAPLAKKYLAQGQSKAQRKKKAEEKQGVKPNTWTPQGPPPPLPPANNPYNLPPLPPLPPRQQTTSAKRRARRRAQARRR